MNRNHKKGRNLLQEQVWKWREERFYNVQAAIVLRQQTLKDRQFQIECIEMIYSKEIADEIKRRVKEKWSARNAQ